MMAEAPLTSEEITQLAKALARQVAREDYESELARLRAEGKATGRHAFTPGEIAERWSCSSSHVRKLIRTGELKAFYFGGKLMRVSADAIKEFEDRAFKGPPDTKAQGVSEAQKSKRN